MDSTFALRPRILVADDNPTIAAYVRDVLTDAGAEVVGLAANGVDALRIYAETLPEAAVLDFQMPMLTGLEVIRAIRAHEQQMSTQRCVAIILTSHTEPSIREQCLLDGADEVLIKHTDVERLWDVVSLHAARHARADTDVGNAPTRDEQFCDGGESTPGPQ